MRHDYSSARSIRNCLRAPRLAKMVALTSPIKVLSYLCAATAITLAQDTTITQINISDDMTTTRTLTGSAASSYLASQSSREASVSNSVSSLQASNSAMRSSIQSQYGNSGIQTGSASITSAASSSASAAIASASSSSSRAGASSPMNPYQAIAMLAGAGGIGAVAALL